MLEALQIVTKMDWPLAFALIGVGWAVAVPLLVRRSSASAERIEELRLRREIQLERFKRGAIPHEGHE